MVMHAPVSKTVKRLDKILPGLPGFILGKRRRFVTTIPSTAIVTRADVIRSINVIFDQISCKGNSPF